MTDQKPEIPEAWKKPPDPKDQWKSTSGKKEEGAIGFRRVMKALGYVLLAGVALLMLALLLLLGTCLVMIAKHG
jgi:hypothetical protein